VENLVASGPAEPRRLGPRPGRPRKGSPPLSAARARILETLRGQAEPTSLAALVAIIDLHENTVREHLEGLERIGLASRSKAPPKGRGRPAWLYEAVEPDPGRSEYAGLAGTLARVIHRGSANPQDDAVAAGEEWGRELAAHAQPAGRGDAGAARHVVALLEELGFAPETGRRHTDVRLTRCPLLEAAYRFPEVVCGVHLGLVRGALEEYDADPTGTELHPFSEPGACTLRLGPTGPEQP
jgi:predicted ArsR family transcriptional regulator